MAKYFRYTKEISSGIVRGVTPYRFNANEIVHMGEAVVRIDASDAQIAEWVGAQNCDPVELPIEEAATIEKVWAKSNGENYNGYMVPFMSEDALALLQVKAAFDMGETSTNIEFSNGTVMPITPLEFNTFSMWFVGKRNSYFK